MSDSEEKTEQPTAHKLREARKKGDVAVSKELTGAVGFMAGFLLLWLGSDFLQGKLRSAVSLAFDAIALDSHSPVKVANIEQMLLAAAWVVGPVFALVATAGLLAAFAQTRGLFSADPLKPKFEKMSPGEALKNMFSTKQLGVLVQMLLKLALLGAATFLTVTSFIGPLILEIHRGPGQEPLAGTAALRALFGACGIVYVALGALDFLHQHFEHIKKNRMSKSERKRENKDQEGDPHLRSALRSRRREIVAAAPRPGLAKANVLITNPTHFAVALYYESAVTELPVVVAKGHDDAALAMLSEAAALSIPLFENPPLARSLFARIGLGEAIEDDHVEAVAEVFRWLASLRSEARQAD